MSVKTITHPLTATEKAIPAPFLLLVDILRAGLCLVAPILFLRLGEQVACVAGGAYSESILGTTIILDVLLGLFWLGQIRRCGSRLLAWCLSEDPIQSYGRPTTF